MKTLKIASLALVLCGTTFLSGCSATTEAQKIQSVVDGIVHIIAVDVPALPPQDASVAQPWTALLVSLDSQLDSCVANATTSGGKKATFLACFNSFAAGVENPQELAQLRIMSPASQTKVEIWATAVILAVNTALTDWGSAAQPTPVVTSAPVANVDLYNLEQELAANGVELTSVYVADFK